MIGKINFIRRFISNLFGKIQPFNPLLKLKANQDFFWGKEQQEALENIKWYLVSPPMLIPPQKHNALMLYLLADEHAIGSDLIQEFEGKECVIYISSVEDSWMLKPSILLLKDCVSAYTFLVPSLDIICYRLSVLW